MWEPQILSGDEKSRVKWRAICADIYTYVKIWQSFCYVQQQEYNFVTNTKITNVRKSDNTLKGQKDSFLTNKKKRLICLTQLIVFPISNRKKGCVYGCICVHVSLLCNHWGKGIELWISLMRYGIALPDGHFSGLVS